MHEQILPSESLHSHRCEFITFSLYNQASVLSRFNSTSHCMSSQCCDLGYHQSISKVFHFYMASRQWAQQNLNTGMQQLDTAVSELNQNQDRDTLMQTNISAFCLPLRFQYLPYEGDQVLLNKMCLYKWRNVWLLMYVSFSRRLRCRQSVRWWVSWWLASSSWSPGCVQSLQMLRRYTNPKAPHTALLLKYRIDVRIFGGMNAVSLCTQYKSNESVCLNMNMHTIYCSLANYFSQLSPPCWMVL